MPPASNIDPGWAIQTAIYGLLTDDTGLMDDVSGVYDEVPEDASLPYVTIGSITVTPQYAHDRFGARSTVMLHIWSAYHGNAEVLEITDHLMRLLDHQDLSIDDQHTVAVRHEQTVTMRDRDADLRHVVVRFSIETEYTT